MCTNTVPDHVQLQIATVASNKPDLYREAKATHNIEERAT